MQAWQRHSTAGAVAVTHSGGASERRDVSAIGVARRKRFEDSLDLLRVLGLSSGAMDHYRHLARKTRKLPHELVCIMAEQAAEGATLATILMSSCDPA